jgi:hypothetical protein
MHAFVSYVRQLFCQCKNPEGNPTEAAELEGKFFRLVSPAKSCVEAPGVLWQNQRMKEISIDEAQSQLDAVCDQALAGEVIRLRSRAGALVEITPVATGTTATGLNASSGSEDEDAEWAAFENHCARASDS